MPYKISIHKISFDGHIGVTDEERSIPQPLEVDVEITSANVTSDNMDDAIDYDAVTRRILTLGQTLSVNLIETFAHRIVEALLEDARVDSVVVRVKKCHPPLKEIMGGFVVEIKQQREERGVRS